jgi:hypothetical protein
MTKAISFAVAIFAISVAQAQAQPPEALIRRIPPVAQPAQQAQQVQQVINLGDVVINVVIAKVQSEGSEPELLIAKFGGKEANATTPRTVTTYTTEQRTRTVNVNGEKVEQIYHVQVPVTQVVQRKVNFTPTEEQRSVPVSMVQAFDLKGQGLDQASGKLHACPSTQRAHQRFEPIKCLLRVNTSGGYPAALSCVQGRSRRHSAESHDGLQCKRFRSLAERR